MDTIELDHYRIRTKRRRLREQKKDFDRQLIRLCREERAIRKQKNSLGWEDLKPPVQQGFKRLFVLREDVKRTNEAKFFENLLGKINTRQWSYRKDFKKKRKQFGKKIYAVREQKLKDLASYEYFGKELNEIERRYFFEVTVVDERRRPVTFYRFAESWRYVLRVQPNMITRVRQKDFDLDKRAADIDLFFRFDNRRNRVDKLMHGRVWHWHWGDKLKYEHPFLNRTFADILDEYLPDHTNNERQLNPRPSGGFCLTIVFCFSLGLFAFPLRLRAVAVQPRSSKPHHPPPHSPHSFVSPTPARIHFPNLPSLIF